MEKERVEKFFERIKFYNENLEKYFKGFEKNYQFGVIEGDYERYTPCLIINDDEGYFRGIIKFAGNFPHHIYTNDGRDIRSHCFDHQLCSIEEEGPRNGENAIEYLLRRTEQIRDEKYKIK